MMVRLYLLGLHVCLGVVCTIECLPYAENFSRTHEEL